MDKKKEMPTIQHDNEGGNDNTSVEESAEPPIARTPPPFEVKDLHTKALLCLLRVHFTGGQPLTYADLSVAISSGQKTKSWQFKIQQLFRGWW
jgi:hypothetical protein